MAARANQIEEIDSAVSLKSKVKIERKNRWKGKKKHGQFIRQTKAVRTEDSWLWLRKGELKRETESLIALAKNQCIRMNLVKTKVDKNQDHPLCRVCKNSFESTDPIVSGLSELAHKEFKT